MAPWSIPTANAVGPNPNQTVNTAVTPSQLAQALVGPGVSVSNVTFTGGADSAGTFSFTDPTVVGFGGGIVMSSGFAPEAVGPNTSTSQSGITEAPGDTDLTALAGYDTFDAAVLEFDFVPTANQVVFQYAFGSEEYQEWVGSEFNDVFAFFVNGTNCATVRAVAGDPASAFVPVAVNRINGGGSDFVWPPSRADLFRPNYLTGPGTSPIDLELDGITQALTCQSSVLPGQTNHMKLAIADASDQVYDSAVFIQAGSLVSNENPVADLSLSTDNGAAPLDITAFVEGEDPNGLPLTYSLSWGDGTSDDTGSLPDETTQVTHTYNQAGHFTVTLTVSNGSLIGTSVEDVSVSGTGGQTLTVTQHPVDQTVHEGDPFTFTASATGDPAPGAQWQRSTDGGQTFTDIDGATTTSYGDIATLDMNGTMFRAAFTSDGDTVWTDPATLTVEAMDSTPPALAPAFTPSAMPFVRNAVVTVEPNASDAETGIASSSCDPVDTSSIGDKTLTCTATNGVGLSNTVTVSYSVGLSLASVSPVDGSTIPRTSVLKVTFTLGDANGALSDADSLAFKPGVQVTLDGQTPVQASWNKKAHVFSASLKIGRPPLGSVHTVAITVTSSSFTALERQLTYTIG